MSEKALELLASIDRTLKALLAQSKSAVLAVATDRDLDSKWGDPEVKFNPRDWSGDSCVGRRMSECPAPFLEMLAETFDYFAKKAEEKDEMTASGKPVAPYKRKDAGLARGWAKRRREGHAPPEPKKDDEDWSADSGWGNKGGDEPEIPSEDDIKWGDVMSDIDQIAKDTLKDISEAVKIAQVCHEANRAYCQTIGDDSQVPWTDAPQWQRDSAIVGVQFCMDHPNSPQSATHDSWLAQKRADGWKYGPVKDAEKKEHPCFVAYEDLPVEQQRKDALFKAVVAALSQ